MNHEDLYQIGQRLSQYARQDPSTLNKRKLLAWAEDSAAGDESIAIVLRNLIEQPTFFKILETEGEVHKATVKKEILTGLSRIFSKKALDEAESLVDGMMLLSGESRHNGVKLASSRGAIQDYARAREKEWHFFGISSQKKAAIILSLAIAGLAIILPISKTIRRLPANPQDANPSENLTATTIPTNKEEPSTKAQARSSDRSKHVYARSFPGSNDSFFFSSWNEANSEREYYYSNSGCRWINTDKAHYCGTDPIDQEWTERVPRVKEFESGAVYFPTQVLANGVQVGGSYLCRLSTIINKQPTPRWAVCTRDGWAAGEEGASPVFIKS